MQKGKSFNTLSWKKYLIYEGASPRVKKFLNSRGDSIFKQITPEVFKAIDLVFMAHPHMNALLSIPKKQYLDFLSESKKWFTNTENYEMCSKILKYQTKLNHNITKDKVKSKKGIFI
mgnify:CR=1 FL=1